MNRRVVKGSHSSSSSSDYQPIYARQGAPPGGDGRSWKTAFNTLDEALLSVDPLDHNPTIWVAAGIYSPILPYNPSGVEGGAAGPGPGSLTFNLPANVRIYGGFKGREKHLDDRPRIHNPLLRLKNRPPFDDYIPEMVVDHTLTILDGVGSESWHVLTAGDDIAKTGANAKLFDLTVRGGYADGPDSGTLDDIFSIVSLDFVHNAGGGLYARYGSVIDIYNVLFIDNASSGKDATIIGKGFPLVSGGGAIAAFDDGTAINIKNSYFKHNSAVEFGVGGGAITIEFNASLNVHESLFDQNTSNRTGGAIRTKDAGDASIKRSYFSRNIARDFAFTLDQSGGAIEVFQGNLFIEDSVFIENDATVGGGAILFHTFLDTGEPYQLDVNHCLFFKNRTGPFGGGAVLIFGQGQHVGSSAKVRNSIFTANTGGFGGAIENTSFPTKIENSEFEDNRAEAWGGAIAITNFGSGLIFPDIAFEELDVVTVKDCVFKHNETEGISPAPLGFPPFFTVPGFLDLFAQLAGVVNNIPVAGSIDQNVQTGGGAIAVLLAGLAKIHDCEFFRNEAEDGGKGGAILVGGATGTATDQNSNQTFDTFNTAKALIDDCKFKGNEPNRVSEVDLANIGSPRLDAEFSSTSTFSH